jgi:AraC-like DNA-binding protein
VSNSNGTACRTERIDVKRLSDMNTARTGHTVLFANGELTVVGGHTNGFVSLSTAEYFSGGKWQQLQMVYHHDDGFALPLQSGKVLIGGGHEKNLGIGQSHEVEMYDPLTHSFEGFGCLALKRTRATALEIDSGRVVIAGNWYHDDGIEVFNGKDSFSLVKEVTVPRCSPYLLQTSNHDVLVIGKAGTKGETIDETLIDRLYGKSFHEPLFETWHLLKEDIQTPLTNCLISDETKHTYTYLLPVVNNSGQVAIIEACDTVFSLLPTTTAVPMKGPWGGIHYHGMIMTDRLSKRAYLAGFDDAYYLRKNDSTRLYLLCIEYDQKPCKLTLYHTDPLPEVGLGSFTITNDGNIVLTGGVLPQRNNNFTPSKAVYLLLVNGKDALISGKKMSWWWLVLALALVVVAVWLYRKYQTPPLAPPLEGRGTLSEGETFEGRGTPNEGETFEDTILMNRICELMENEKPFLNSNLKITDVAAMLHTNRTYVSNCINNQRNCTFMQFINTYRVAYAQKLMKETDKKMPEIWLTSGFANETSFFRTFKSVTGMTPSEWKTNTE